MMREHQYCVNIKDAPIVNINDAPIVNINDAPIHGYMHSGRCRESHWGRVAVSDTRAVPEHRLLGADPPARGTAGRTGSARPSTYAILYLASFSSLSFLMRSFSC
jgi:hypothetical protein